MEELVIATKVYEPLISGCALENLEKRPLCQQPGLDSEILHHALTLGNISYRLTPHPETPWGSERNGSWTGLLGLIFNGSIGMVQIITLLYEYESQFSEIGQDQDCYHSTMLSSIEIT